MKTVQQCLHLLIITLIGWTIKLSLAEIRVVCYYTNWSVYRPGTAKFNPQNINPYLCTHLIYAFGGFTKESNFKPFDKYQDIEKGGYAKFTGLKTYNKNLKTMLAIGGWNEGSSRFSPMVANAEKRREFVKNSIKFLRQNHFDGLDLDWEYPAFRDGGKSRDRDNYASLVQELREEYERESEKTGRPRLLLTMAVPAGIEYINKGYDVPKLMKYLDWMNILSYDYHSAFEPAVNHHSPLYGLEEESEYNYDSDLNINHTISHYLEAGAISEKLVLGIPTYGRSYTLFNPDATDIGSPADGPGEMGDATRENGYLAYYEICEKIKESDEWFVEQPNPNAMGPYAYKDNQWVGYDDENIVRKKSEFVAKNKLGGIMFWSIDNDDFRGACTGKPYPLIEAAKEALMTASGYIVDNVIPAPDKPVKAESKRKRKRPTSAPKKEEEEITERLSNKRRIKISNKQESNDEVTESAAKTRREKIRNESRRKSTAATSTTLSSINRYTTPEPPTTPDAGTDFKCEDEGFFPHPRDCKKYYWCLSSGPSELGIIAHQFTCPSGLYFNKAADSCDYTQNVLCNKKKTPPKTTTSTPTTPAIPSTTEAATSPVSISLSTRRPLPKITAATSRTTFVQSSTVEYEDEYEYEDEENKEKGDTENSEEDPRVIKELLDLIKKAGGIEELEKQLNHYETNSTSVTVAGSTTPSSFSKSLYQRVLNRAVGGKNKETSFRTNNSGGPQFKGSQDSSSKSRRTRPQYTAISRQRQTSEKSEQDEAVIEEGKSDDNEEEEETSKSHFVPEYKTIIRSRTTTTTELSPDVNDVTQPLQVLDEDKEVEKQVVTSKTPEYVTLSRRRLTTSTTTGDSTTPKYLEIRGRSSTTEQTSSTTPESTTTAAKIEDINVTVSFRSIPGEEASTTETNATKKDEKDNILIKSDSQTVYIASTTEPAKVSDNFSSKNPSRSRFYTKITRPTTNTESTVDHYQTTNRSKSKFTLHEKSFHVENQKVSHSNEQVSTERARSKFTLHEVDHQKKIHENDEQISTERATRGSMRFGQQANSAQNGGLNYDDGSYHPDLYQERKFRPDIAIEISDLSSLTSADLSIKDGSRGHRHRRPLPKQQTNESVENSQFHKKEIIKSVQVQEIETTTVNSSKERTISLPKIQKPNSLFNRRLRPNLAINETKVLHGRRRVNAESVSENNVTPSVTENATVKRRLLKRVKSTPSQSTVSASIPTTTSTFQHTTVTTSPQNITSSSFPTTESTSLFTTVSTTSTSLSTTNTITSPTTNSTPHLENNSIIASNANVSVEYEDDVYKTSEEEEENIKLSESNIREASEVNINSFSDKPRRRIVKKIIEGKSAQLKVNALENFELPTTGVQQTFRRRTIVNKLQSVTEPIPSGTTQGIERTSLKNLSTATEEIPSTSTQGRRRTVLRKIPSTTEAVPTNLTKNGRTRKIVRRLKVPSTSYSDETTSAELSASLERGAEDEIEVKNETILVETTVRNEEEVTTEINVDPTTDSDILTTIFEQVETTSPQTTTVTTAKSTTSIYYKAKFSRPPFLKQRSRPTTEASTRQISTRSNLKTNALSRFNTRRKSILGLKDTDKVKSTIAESVQNVTEVELVVTTATSVAVNTSTIELTSDAPESTTLYYDVIPTTTQNDIESGNDASTEPFDEIKFVTDSVLEKELMNLIKLYEEQKLSKAESTTATENSTQIIKSTLTDNAIAEIQNVSLTDNSTETQNDTKTKLKPNPLLRTPLQRPKFVPKVKTTERTLTKSTPENGVTVKTDEYNGVKSQINFTTFKLEDSSSSTQNSLNDFVTAELVYETDSNGTEASKENVIIENSSASTINDTEIQEVKSVTNHPLFAYRFVTTQKQENETELEISSGSTINVTETNRIRTLVEILETEKLNAAKKNGTRTNKFKKILENEALKTSTTRRPSFKPKNRKRTQNRLNDSTINKETLAALQETKEQSPQNNDSANSEEDEASTEVNESLIQLTSEEENEDDITNTSNESGEITKTLAFKRPAFLPKLEPLTNRDNSDTSEKPTENERDDDDDKLTQKFIPKLATVNHNFKPLPPLSDFDVSKENQDVIVRQKFVPKRPTFKPKFNQSPQLTLTRHDVENEERNEEIENELITEKQMYFETVTESDDSFDGENQDNENSDDTATQQFPSREGTQRSKFVPKSKLKNKPEKLNGQEDGSEFAGHYKNIGFVPQSFGSNRKNISKIANNPELQLQTLVQTANARNALFHKTRKANTPFVGTITSSTTGSTTEEIVITDKIIDAITVAYEEELQVTEEVQRAKDIQEKSLKQREEQVQETDVVQKQQKVQEVMQVLQEQEDQTQKMQEQVKVEHQEVEKQQEQVAETTSEKQPETTEQSFTLHHIFAEAPNSTPLTTTEKETFVDLSTRDAKKLERLIEVNRIVEVSLKEGKFKHNLMVENEMTLGPILDRIGEINRVTVIKVVDPNGDLKIILKQNNTSNETAKIEKAEISEPYGKLTRYGDKLEAYLLPAKSQDLEDLKTKIEIYGKSIVNKYTPVTPEPPFSAEFSTIALEGLFKPFTTEDPSKEEKDEILETENANYVNIRVLKDESDQATVLKNKPPEVESRARVVEITPEMNSKIIKIAPITISFSSTRTVNQN